MALSTRPCSTEPPGGTASQKQPPARGSIVMFPALPDQLCSGSHQEAGFTIIAQAASGEALTTATD
jgi:hypothetical protein